MRQAGSYVGPDKLRFDFSHGAGDVSAQELRDVEDQINAWIVENHPVRPITTTLDEARALGAMALFGEKYGEIVRMVEIGDGEFSRELCGGTHVRSTAEIGVVRIISETSSAANVRRIEALSGPAAVASLRGRSDALEEIAARAADHAGAGGRRGRARAGGRAARAREGGARGGARRRRSTWRRWPRRRRTIGGVPVVCATIEVPDAKALPDVADRVKGKLGSDGVDRARRRVGERAHVVVSVGAGARRARRAARTRCQRPLSAVLGGGGGGRDTLAQRRRRRGRRASTQALEAARAAIVAAAGG